VGVLFAHQLDHFVEIPEIIYTKEILKREIEMKITKEAVKKLVGLSQSKVDGVRFSPDETPQDHKKRLRQLTQDVERRSRSKDITIVIVE